MPYSINATGLEELQANFERLGKAAMGIASVGVYKGAGVIADSVGTGIQGISSAPFMYAKNGEKRMPSPEEVAMLQGAAYGIAKHRKNGLSVQTRIGFDNSGYAVATWNHQSNKVRTKYKWMNGKAVSAQKIGAGGGASLKPIPLIANAINSGTSFMNKQPFFRRAVSKSQGAAKGIMEDTIEQLLRNLNL